MRKPTGREKGIGQKGGRTEEIGREKEGKGKREKGGKGWKEG